MTRGRVAVLLVTGVLSAACGGEAEVGRLTGTSGATAEAASTGPTATVATATGPTGATATGATGEALPPLATLSHGGRAFGVYVAAAPFGSPELDAAVEQLGALGVEAFPSDISCDEGAAEQLGVPSDVAVVAIYLETRADAEAWAAALDPPPVGIAAVRTLCLD